ncbi:hypothetical protein cyc_06570 [Cyclospora cayetanensis]|uniref:Uncharacterized protein n=1 Tax=Cyclospora cayetanensis TaxID=88456 RepID=A0A1D3CTW9_9EIME|nr:hypothetical protein cyc_06570 [Cyclospora cayetanensis]
MYDATAMNYVLFGLAKVAALKQSLDATRFSKRRMVPTFACWVQEKEATPAGPRAAIIASVPQHFATTLYTIEISINQTFSHNMMPPTISMPSNALNDMQPLQISTAPNLLAALREETFEDVSCCCPST